MKKSRAFEAGQAVLFRREPTREWETVRTCALAVPSIQDGTGSVTTRAGETDISYRDVGSRLPATTESLDEAHGYRYLGDRSSSLFESVFEGFVLVAHRDDQNPTEIAAQGGVTIRLHILQPELEPIPGS